MRHLLGLFVAATMASLMVLTACTGPAGPAGPPASAGPPGPPGAAAPTPPPYQLPSTMEVAPGTTPDKKFVLTTKTADVVIGDGIVYRGMTFDGTIPGPLLLVEEGDVVEVEVRNEDTIAHGLSFHATYRATSPMVGNIEPGQTKKLLFKATYPGVYMYHCAPGGQGIFAHTMFGMYGMVVVEPKEEKYKLEELLGKAPDIRLYFLQHEIYSSGKDAAEARPLYVMFNGYNYRYVAEPIQARPGDYVRVYYLNVGPNLTGTLHLVGIVWDFMYYQGHPRNVMYGGQSSVAGPSDSWVVEFRVPEAGSYLIVTHAFGTQASRGAVGLLSVAQDAQRTPFISAQGPKKPLPTTDQTKRVVSTYGFGSSDVDPIVTIPKGEEPLIKLIGNSFWPKVARVSVGTTVTWVNEDVFTFPLHGESTGQHPVSVADGPEKFTSPILNHADKYSYTFTKPGKYEYYCPIHPYMKGVIEVISP